MGTRNLDSKDSEGTLEACGSSFGNAECVVVKGHCLLVVEVVAVKGNCQLALLLPPLSFALSCGSSVFSLCTSLLKD